MNILCTICARKGSKGLKNKNFLKLNGKELFWYSYNQAKKVKSISNIVISTDSDQLIKKVKSKKIDIFLKDQNLSRVTILEKSQSLGMHSKKLKIIIKKNLILLWIWMFHHH